MCVVNKYTRSLLFFIIGLGCINTVSAQSTELACVTDKEGNTVCSKKVTKSIEVASSNVERSNLRVIGMNLRNGDGTEMGPFNVMESAAGTDVEMVPGPGPKSKPSMGFDSEAYSKAMATGKFPKGEEEGQFCSKPMKKGPSKNYSQKNKN